MSCEEWLERLSAHLDGALPSPDREEVDFHLTGCAVCRARLESLRAVKHAVARLPGREDPPGAVRAHVESLRFARGGGPATRAIVIVAVAMAVGVLGTRVFVARPRHGPPLRLAEDLVGDHLRSVPEAMPAEVTSHDPQEVAAFFAGRVAFTPIAPTFPMSRLVGGRLCQIEGRRVQLLFYESGGERLSLYVSDRDLAEEGCQESRGHHVCSRRSDDKTLLLVGKLSEDQLLQMLESAAR